MGEEPKRPDYYLIDIEDNGELIYIATKLGCEVKDILSAIETMKTRKRATIYSYLIDNAFKAHLK